MSDWSISRGQQKCQQCAKEFVEKVEYFSALYDKDRQFIRHDYCIDCWESQDKESMYSFWKTRVPEKEEEAQEVLS